MDWLQQQYSTYIDKPIRYIDEEESYEVDYKEPYEVDSTFERDCYGFPKIN